MSPTGRTTDKRFRVVAYPTRERLEQGIPDPAEREAFDTTGEALALAGASHLADYYQVDVVDGAGGTTVWQRVAGMVTVDVTRPHQADAQASEVVHAGQRAGLHTLRAEGGHVVFDVPNSTLDGEGFYVSYNERDHAHYGGSTTALVVGQMQHFYILNGDHRAAYQPLIAAGLESALDYFVAHPDAWNRYSDRVPCSEAATTHDLPEGWTEATPGGLATCRDPSQGGIVDQALVNDNGAIVRGRWFVVFNREGVATQDGFASRRDALQAWRETLTGLDGIAPDKVTAEASTRLSVTIELTVQDPAAFRQAAYTDALEAGLDHDEAAKYLDPAKMSLGQCAVMLVDPGAAPAGACIESSSYEAASQAKAMVESTGPDI